MVINLTFSKSTIVFIDYRILIISINETIKSLFSHNVSELHDNHIEQWTFCKIEIVKF